MLYLALLVSGLSLIFAIKSNLDKESIEFTIKKVQFKSDAVSHRCLQLNAEMKDVLDELARIEALVSKSEK